MHFCISKQTQQWNLSLYQSYQKLTCLLSILVGVRPGWTWWRVKWYQIVDLGVTSSVAASISSKRTHKDIIKKGLDCLGYIPWRIGLNCHCLTLLHFKPWKIQRSDLKKKLTNLSWKGPWLSEEGLEQIASALTSIGNFFFSKSWTIRNLSKSGLKYHGIGFDSYQWNMKQNPSVHLFGASQWSFPTVLLFLFVCPCRFFEKKHTIHV